MFLFLHFIFNCDQDVVTVYLCLCVHVCIYAYLSVHVCGHVHTHVWRSEVNLTCHSFHISCHLETGSLTGIWGFPIRLSWLANKPLESTCHSFPALGLHVCATMPDFLVVASDQIWVFIDHTTSTLQSNPPPQAQECVFLNSNKASFHLYSVDGGLGNSRAMQSRCLLLRCFNPGLLGK